MTRVREPPTGAAENVTEISIGGGVYHAQLLSVIIHPSRLAVLCADSQQRYGYDYVLSADSQQRYGYDYVLSADNRPRWL